MRAPTAEKSTATPQELLSELVARSKRKGATAAEALLFDGSSMSVSQRLGARENLKRAESQDVGLRVFLGQRQAMVSSNDMMPAALESLMERALSMARAAPEDPYCGLADPALLAKSYPDLALYDPYEPTGEELYQRAGETEDAARAVKGVTNSDGAGANWRRSKATLVTSDGFVGSYASSGFGSSVSVVAGAGTAMETDHASSYARHRSDLRAPAEVGTEAGERATRRVNPRKVSSASMPVVFEPRVSNSMLGNLAGAITGPAIARGVSFLRKELGQQVFATGIRVIDDPLMPRELGSRPFDGEGVAVRRMALIEDGVLTTWLLSSADARQLNLRSTGHAARGIGSPPSPSTSNLYLEPGSATPEELMSDIREGVYLTDLIGMGVNGVTGDYSMGAAGFKIESGKLTYPISEFTVASNLREMFRNLMPANDLRFRYGTNAPTIRIDGMTVAGK